MFGDIPDGWWLSSTNCCHLLAALVHRGNPDIVTDPTTVDAGTTRNNIRSAVADDQAKDLVAAKTAATTVRGQMEESMLMTKATLMKKNIELQETENIKEQLLLMEKFKPSFVNVNNSMNGADGTAVDGELEYDRNIYNLLDELPFRKKQKAESADKQSGDN